MSDFSIESLVCFKHREFLQSAHAVEKAFEFWRSVGSVFRALRPINSDLVLYGRDRVDDMVHMVVHTGPVGGSADVPPEGCNVLKIRNEC